MDAESLLSDLDYLSAVGITLSTEQKASLQGSLVLLKSKEKFHSIVFWGKISGIAGQYFIVQGRGKDPMKERKNLYRYNKKPALSNVAKDVEIANAFDHVTPLATTVASGLNCPSSTQPSRKRL